MWFRMIKYTFLSSSARIAWRPLRSVLAGSAAQQSVRLRPPTPTEVTGVAGGTAGLKVLVFRVSVSGLWFRA